MKTSENKKDIVWFGMKLSPAEKQKIELLAKKKGVSKKEAIMSLVNDEVLDYSVIPKKGSLLEKANNLIGKVEGPGDISTNPKYLEDYGKDSLR